MSGSSDLRHIAGFAPKVYRCENCLSLSDGRWLYTSRTKNVVCPACSIEYVPSDSYDSAREYLEASGYRSRFRDLLGHARALAILSGRFSGEYANPLAMLVRLFNSAQEFIHFVSHGLDLVMLGILAATSERVRVYGVVNNSAPSAVKEIQTLRDDFRRLELRTYDNPADRFGGPHQKLLVVDGLIGLTGSANLTTNSYRQAANAHNMINVITDTDEVADINNKFFSTAWLSVCPPSEKRSQVEMWF